MGGGKGGGPPTADPRKLEYLKSYCGLSKTLHVVRKEPFPPNEMKGQKREAKRRIPPLLQNFIPQPVGTSKGEDPLVCLPAESLFLKMGSFQDLAVRTMTS